MWRNVEENANVETTPASAPGTDGDFDSGSSRGYLVRRDA
jgi:hypothetical protein